MMMLPMLQWESHPAMQLIFDNPHQAGHVEDDHGCGRSSAGRTNGGVGEVLLASKTIFWEVSIVGIAQ